MNFIELFAGCGGLSLGLKSIGFNLVLANEFSPMAAESYSYNFFDEDLQTESVKSAPNPLRTLWLNSKFPKNKLKERLGENPRLYPPLDHGFNDLESNGSNLEGSLVVGSIVDFNLWLKQNPKVEKLLKNSFGRGEVDLVSGGPPCQSFSMAGMRELESDRNTLPWEFARFVHSIQPRIVMLENVSGILRPFKDHKGNKFYAWFEISKAFATVGYIPLCLHINAKNVGVPQNRPRFILLGIRSDIFDLLKPVFTKIEDELFQEPYEFYCKVKEGKDVDLSDLQFRDISKQADKKFFNDTFLERLTPISDNFVTVKDAIDDLRKTDLTQSKFAVGLSKTFNKVLSKRKMQNHALRSNSDLVRRRFRLYQVLQQVNISTRKSILSVVKGDHNDISDDCWQEISKFDFLVESGEFIHFNNKHDFLDFVNRHPTKKQTQKALLSNLPAPAALSIPDDACHYHRDEQRTLTVREMARIQSFPDNFEFRSKITTGGQMRKFEVPQYTQVGNAVPPLLGRALGLCVKDLLSRIQELNN